MPVGDGWDFTVVIPTGWYIREPDLSLRDQSITDFVDDMIARNADLAVERAEMIDQFGVFSKDADEKMALIAAMLLDAGHDVPIAADIRIHEAHRGAPDSIDTELALLEESLAAEETDDLGPREVRSVELPAGPAIRLRMLSQTAPDERGHTIALDVVQHWVPVPGRPDMILISSSTPNLVFADDLVKVFDAVAESLEFHGHA